jgi:hypothetical protein
MRLLPPSVRPSSSHRSKSHRREGCHSILCPPSATAWTGHSDRPPRPPLRHDLRPTSPLLHDLRVGALHHSSGLPPVVPSCPTHATVEHSSSVRFSSLRPLYRNPREPDVVLDRIPRLPVLPVHRILAGTTAMRHEPSTSLDSSQAERLRWARPLRSGWAEQCRGSPNEQCCLLFFLQIISLHSKSNSNF